jgi:hypothetical protein
MPHHNASCPRHRPAATFLLLQCVPQRLKAADAATDRSLSSTISGQLQAASKTSCSASAAAAIPRTVPRTRTRRSSDAIHSCTDLVHFLLQILDVCVWNR